MIVIDKPIARLECTECGDLVSVYGDDRLTPKRETFRCVMCLDPRQRALPGEPLAT